MLYLCFFYIDAGQNIEIARDISNFNNMKRPIKSSLRAAFAEDTTVCTMYCFFPFFLTHKEDLNIIFQEV